MINCRNFKFLNVTKKGRNFSNAKNKIWILSGGRDSSRDSSTWSITSASLMRSKEYYRMSIGRTYLGAAPLRVHTSIYATQVQYARIMHGYAKSNRRGLRKSITRAGALRR